MVSKKRVILLIVTLFIITAICFVVIKVYQDTPEEHQVTNYDEYIINIFDFDAGYSNMLSEEPGVSITYALIYDSMYMENSITNGYEEINISAENRENLEAELISLIDTHNLVKWHGYDEYLEVMDASDGFSFRVEYKNGDEIIANGSFMYPDNYDEVKSDIKEIFDKYYNLSK